MFLIILFTLIGIQGAHEKERATTSQVLLAKHGDNTCERLHEFDLSERLIIEKACQWRGDK